MSSRWSTARVTAIASALAIGGSAVVATPALAKPGDAQASAVQMQLSLELTGETLLDVDAAVATEGPPGELVIPDLAAHVGSLTGASVGGRTTLSTASGDGGTESSALVEDLSVSVLGVEAVAATAVSSSADCLSGELPAAETNSQGVTVLGKSVDLTAIPAAGVEISASADVEGMTSAEVTARVKPSAVKQNASSARATGVSVNLMLKGTAPEVGPIASIWLGRVLIGDVSCEHQEDPAEPTAEELQPAAGVDTGGDTVTLRGSGFTGDTTVDVGGEKATDVVVLSANELTFTTPANPAGVAVVTATTRSGTSAGLEFSYNEAPPEEPVIEVLDPDEVPATGGSEVWVFGSGFVRGSTSVTVGDTVIPANNVEILNTGTLIVRAPAHAAGPAPLSVTTPVGTSGTIDLNYVAVVVPPSITSVTPNSGPLEGNTVVTLKGTGFVPNATMVTMDTASFLDDDVTVVSDTELSFKVPAGTEGPVNIDVTTAAGTSNQVVFTYAASATPPDPVPMPDPVPTPAEGHDFSGDGNVDVLARDTSGRLWLYAGDGAKGWQPRVQVGSGWNIMTSILGPGDFSGDGKADVLARDTSGRLWLYAGDGAKGWQPRVQVGSGWNIMTSILGPGDFSGDGKVDVLARDRDGRLWLYKGDGAGGWQPRVQVGAGWNIMTSIAAPGDFSGDGKVDVLARDRDGRLWLYPGDGAKGWQPRVQVGSGWNIMTSIL